MFLNSFTSNSGWLFSPSTNCSNLHKLICTPNPFVPVRSVHVKPVALYLQLKDCCPVNSNQWHILTVIAMQIFDILSDFLKNKIVYSYWIFRMSKFSPFPSSSPQKAKINIIFLDWMLNYFFKNKLLTKKKKIFLFFFFGSLQSTWVLSFYQR